MIVQKLREIQHKHGWLPERELRELSVATETPLHRIHEVASFFPHYRLKQGPKVDVAGLPRHGLPPPGRPGAAAGPGAVTRPRSAAGRSRSSGVSCLGQCDSPPALAINDACFWGISASQARSRIRAALAKEPIHQQRADRSPLGWQIDIYDGQPRYEAVRFLVTDVEGGPVAGDRRDQVIESLKVSGLRGMGGAGFPTHLKWASRPVAARPREVRRLQRRRERAGHLQGPRADPPDAPPAGRGDDPGRAGRRARPGAASTSATSTRRRSRSSRRPSRPPTRPGSAATTSSARASRSTLEVFVSPGGYICGEETALLEAMEDRRGEPRNKPPFPVFSGLYGKPTVINNVETLCWTPGIAMRGGEWYRDGGTRGATGLRFVSISGDVNDPGVYEVPFGQTVRELVFGSAGGMIGDQKLKAIATSGPSGGFLPARLLQEEPRLAPIQGLGREELRPRLGHLRHPRPAARPPDPRRGGQHARRRVRRDRLRRLHGRLRPELRPVLPERVVRQVRPLPGRLAEAGRPPDPDHPGQVPPTATSKVVNDLAQSMSLTSICGLGQIAANPMKTVMKHFPEELEEHLKHRRCPAGICFRD